MATLMAPDDPIQEQEHEMRTTVFIVAGVCGLLASGLPAQDPSYLRLPHVTLGTKDHGEAPNRIVVDIVEPRFYLKQTKSKLDPKKPPILIDGRQVDSLVNLREQLRLKADPTRFPDKSKPEVSPGIYPSNIPILVRCDREQIFGWVQILFQSVTFIPGRPLAEEVKLSPLIYKVEMATEGGTKLVSYLPTDKGVRFARKVDLEDAEVILKVPSKEWVKSPTDRAVLFTRPRSDTPFGRSRGLKVEADGKVSLDLDPPDTLKKVARYLKAVRAKSPESRAKINSYARTPYFHVMQILDLMIAAGFHDIRYSGIPAQLMHDIEARRIK